MSSKNLKIGSVAEIHFLDHALGDLTVEPVEAIVWGRIIKNESKYIVICAWLSPHEDDSESDCYTILKSCISVARNLGV